MLRIERAAGPELTEGSTIGGQVTGAHLKHRPACEYDAHHAMGRDGRTTHTHERHRHDGVVVDAVHEVSDA
jgi:hypothetical protein